MKSTLSSATTASLDLAPDEQAALLCVLLRALAARAEVEGSHHEGIHFAAALEALDYEHEPSACLLLVMSLPPAERARRIALLLTIVAW